MNMNDVKILYSLYKNDHTAEVKAATIKKIEELTELSNTRVRYTIRSLLMAEFIHEGCRNGNAATYYVTKKGMIKLKEVSKDEK